MIRFEDVSKRFILRHQRARSFQETFLNLASPNGMGRETEEFWALQNVSFDIAAGETVGLVGPNGVGKSTVLKLIARIIEPTSGTIEVEGRVGALLELGAGFHDDLTGRENIYLNGSLLGMDASEVSRRLDDIVAFAEMERFIDVPVKHYSSGMYVRLGFSVAVHADPEILLIDEVLAVGDAAFQRKCHDRIDALRRKGVTLLFVSHSADAVRRLCDRAIWLDSGMLAADGASDSVVQRYIDQTWSTEDRRLPAGGDVFRWGSGRVRITHVQLLDKMGNERQSFESGEPLTIALQYQTSERVENPVFGLAIHRSDGLHITGPNTQFSGLDIPCIEGDGTVLYTLDAVPLLEGSYSLSVSATNDADTEMYDYHDRLYPFRVRAAEGRERYGLVALGGRWAWSRS